MCGDAGKANKQNPSSADIPGTTQTSSGRCCWCEDFETEVVSSKSKYWTGYLKSESRYGSSFYDTNKWKLTVSMAGAIKAVTLEMKLGTIPGGYDQQTVNAVWELFVSGVNKYWNNKAKLVIDDPECGVARLPIVIKATPATSSPHRKFILKPGRANARNLAITVDPEKLSVKEGLEWTLAHEFGHAFGLPDEYADGGSYIGGYIRYIRADGLLGSKVPVIPNDGGRSASSSTSLMGAGMRSLLFPHHFWCIAIESQKLLNSKLRKGIKCDIEL